MQTKLQTKVSTNLIYWRVRDVPLSSDRAWRTVFWFACGRKTTLGKRL